MKKRCPSHASPTKKNSQKTRIEYEFSTSSIGPYLFDTNIGKGAFSSVVKVSLVDNPRAYLACKIINKDEINKDKIAKIQFEREIRVKHQLHHPGIIEFADILCDEKNYYIIMPYYRKGSLHDFITKNKKPLEEEKAKVLFKQIIETLQYIQQMGVSHRDLKPENILFNEKRQLVIADFGFSCFVQQPREEDTAQKRRNLVKSRCGTAEYAPPEIVLGGKEPYDGFASDIWSCGVILYEMVTKELPWKRSDDINVIREQIINGQYKIPSYLSDSCQDLIKKMMNIKADERITLSKICDHDWLKGVPKQYDISKMNYSPISIKTIDAFFKTDDLGEEIIPNESNEENARHIFKADSEKSISFRKQISEITKSYSNKSDKTKSSSIIRPPNKRTSMNNLGPLSTSITNRKKLMPLKTSNQILALHNPNHHIMPPRSKPRQRARRFPLLKPIDTTDTSNRPHQPIEVRPPEIARIHNPSPRRLNAGSHRPSKPRM